MEAAVNKVLEMLDAGNRLDAADFQKVLDALRGPERPHDNDFNLF